MRARLVLGSLVVAGSLAGLGVAGASAAGAAGDVCVSVNGTTVVDQPGGSTCLSGPESGSVAVAVNDSTAFAIGLDSHAVAVNNSYAIATRTSDSNAIAINGSDAQARYGGDALAVNDSVAYANGGRVCAMNGRTATPGYLQDLCPAP